MRNQIKKSRTRKSSVALFEIFLLITSIIAFSYILGGQFQQVSAQITSNHCVQDTNGVIWEISGDRLTCVKNCVSPPYVIDIPEFCQTNSAKCDAKSSPHKILDGAKISCGFSQQEPGGPIWDLARSEFTRWSVAQGLNKVKERIQTPDLTSGSASTGTSNTDPKTSKMARLFDPRYAPEAGYGWNWGTFGNLGGYIAVNALAGLGIRSMTTSGVKAITNDERLAESLGKGAMWGYWIGAATAKTLTVMGVEGALMGVVPLLGLPILGLVFAGIGILYQLFTYKKERYDAVVFSCMPWDAPRGGQDCDLCNKDDIPCTEYRCMSLGTHCEYLINEQLCIFSDRADINPPVIQPWDIVLTDTYVYSPDEAISPPDRGVKIVPVEDADGCVVPFTPLRFGVTLDKPARCKISTKRPTSFQDMADYSWMSNGLLIYNHSYQMSIPSKDSLDAQEVFLREGWNFNLYIMCETKQGYSTQNYFIFKFCVDEGPDTREPIITRETVLNNSPISFNQKEINVNFYTNEPAECRWSRIDQAYNDMLAENQVNCPESLSSLDDTLSKDFLCESATLKGLLNNQNNDFYIRCIDQPHLKGTEEEYQRNANEKSYFYRLIGTRPLSILSVAPNSTTIRDSTLQIKVNLEVETFAGFKEGAAKCSFSPTGENRFIQFFNTGTHEHSQRLDLVEGTYAYDIKCMDDGGNLDSKQITFVVETDNMAPIVVRIFREANNLVIITDEDAMCVYDNLDCNYLFDDGVKMATQDYRTHSVAWNPERTFYIKCEDEFGNQPMPNQCSIIARPFELS